MTRWAVNIWKIMDYKGLLDVGRRKDRSDQTFSGCYGKKKGKKMEKKLPMKNVQSPEFIYRCIHKTWLWNEWFFIACVAHMHMCVPPPLHWPKCACIPVRNLTQTGQALTDESMFVLTSIQSGFTLREICFLTLCCSCLMICEAYTISLLPVCLYTCGVLVCFAYVWCACIFSLEAFVTQLRKNGVTAFVSGRVSSRVLHTICKKVNITKFNYMGIKYLEKIFEIFWKWEKSGIKKAQICSSILSKRQYV